MYHASGNLSPGEMQMTYIGIHRASLRHVKQAADVTQILDEALAGTRGWFWKDLGEAGGEAGLHSSPQTPGSARSVIPLKLRRSEPSEHVLCWVKAWNLWWLVGPLINDSWTRWLERSIYKSLFIVNLSHVVFFKWISLSPFKNTDQEKLAH